MKKRSKKSSHLSSGDEDLREYGATGTTIDPALDALFQSSLVGSNVTFKKQTKGLRKPAVLAGHEDSTASTSDSDLSAHEVDKDEPSGVTAVLDSPESDAESTAEPQSSAPAELPQRRKRKRVDENLEDRYLERLAAEQRREEAARRREAESSKDPTDHPDHSADIQQDGSASSLESEGEQSQDETEIPQHETLTTESRDAELEKANRTVFLSNVSATTIASKSAHRILRQHLSSFLSELPSNTPPHKVESIRFRSTAFATTAIPKRAAFAKKELMEATTKSTNAYAVYSTSLAAREAVKRLNGTIVLDRHLRVDSVAHPTPIDHRRCVFVGNLGFVDDESLVRAAEEKEGQRPQKAKPPGDVEEGLWRQFSNAGAVESVRVVRDPQTRVGKGFAYVQFVDENAVERALGFHDKKYPPLLPRVLRVVRARKFSKSANAAKEPKPSRPPKNRIYNPKISGEAQSFAGRAQKLFGRGGAARLASNDPSSDGGLSKLPARPVLEGHRARNDQGAAVLKSSRTGKGKGQAMNRSRRRAAAYKAAGGRKGGK